MSSITLRQLLINFTLKYQRAYLQNHFYSEFRKLCKLKVCRAFFDRYAQSFVRKFVRKHKHSKTRFYECETEYLDQIIEVSEENFSRKSGGQRKKFSELSQRQKERRHAAFMQTVDPDLLAFRKEEPEVGPQMSMEECLEKLVQLEFSRAKWEVFRKVMGKGQIPCHKSIMKYRDESVIPPVHCESGQVYRNL